MAVVWTPWWRSSWAISARGAPQCCSSVATVCRRRWGPWAGSPARTLAARTSPPMAWRDRARRGAGADEDPPVRAVGTGVAQVGDQSLANVSGEGKGGHPPALAADPNHAGCPVDIVELEGRHLVGP